MCDMCSCWTDNSQAGKYVAWELPHWKAMVSEDTELKDSTDDEENCTLIDGIEFKTGKYIEEITDQLKEIDVIMAELEGCL
ncbi:hypothetical protein scyTo_0007675 [Scyliorhinus torazame]|uniref:Uncharacterized protein n=1 Tax=Scyliorhinus torazame TaxID=75743 RepID=A0A401NWH7_SCYTO|nr:hypothetical protein [Scyliorhinus torazame]